LFTTNPDDLAGVEGLVRVIPVTRPTVPHKRDRSDSASS
jgi:hypothetical protein